MNATENLARTIYARRQQRDVVTRRWEMAEQRDRDDCRREAATELAGKQAA